MPDTIDNKSEQINSFQVDRIRDRMQDLQEALDNAVPGFIHILSDIHETLRAEPEIVTLLTPEEISGIVRGLSAHANIVITTTKAKTKVSKKPVTAADL